MAVTEKLDQAGAMHKQRVIAQLQRKKPSREHIRAMGSKGDLFDAMPTFEEESPARPDPPHRPRRDSEGKEAASSSHPPPAHKPKPLPRPAPRQKTTSPVEGGAVKPHAVPRHKTHPEISSPDSEDKSVPAGLAPAGLAPTSSSPIKVPTPVESKLSHQSPRASPVVAHKELLKSSPKPSPKHTPKVPPPTKQHSRLAKKNSYDKIEEPDGDTDLSPAKEPIFPKPAPRHQGQSSKDEDSGLSPALDAQPEEAPERDPMELTVKEKAQLAGRALQAADKAKFAPPVPRKPKSSSTDDQIGVGRDPEVPPSRLRAKSFDDFLDESPKRKRKLPPGAFNMGLPIGPAQMRSPSNPTDEREHGHPAHDAETDTVHPSVTAEVTCNEPPSLDNPDSQASSSRPLLPCTPSKEPKFPPKRPPPPQHKPAPEDHSAPLALNQISPQHHDETADTSVVSSADLLEPSPRVEDSEVRPSVVSPENLDFEQILLWTPEHVVLWLERIGLQQHRQVFVDRGIRGHMLFDLDGSRLKVSLAQLSNFLHLFYE